MDGICLNPLQAVLRRHGDDLVRREVDDGRIRHGVYSERSASSINRWEYSGPLNDSPKARKAESVMDALPENSTELFLALDESKRPRCCVFFSSTAAARLPGRRR
jgi:hypothetical protein